MALERLLSVSTVESRGVVILAGAGASMAPPACVMSWWDFNNAVLRQIQHLATSGGSQTGGSGYAGLSPADEAWIKSLTLHQLDVSQFSQIVWDAFAGPGWFQSLNALEGLAPNTTHVIAAQLAARGLLRAVLTTNFDTMFERALDDVGVKYMTYTTADDQVPSKADVVHVVKLHGTVGQGTTMIDLASQKHRGLAQPWVSWCSNLFASAATAVIGFSGRDLELHEDYLGLFAAADSTPHLLWVAHPGSSPLPKVVSRLLSALGDRGELLSADVDELAEELGVSTPAFVGACHRQGLSTSWLGPDQFVSLRAAVAIMRLFRAAGETDKSRKVRNLLREHVKDKTKNGATVEEMAWLSLVAAQCGSDNFADRKINEAYVDLTISINIFDQFLKIVRETGMSFDEEALQEQQWNRSGVMSNLARAAAILGKPEAESYAKHALYLAETLTDALRRTQRMANAYAAYVTVCQLSGRISDAKTWAIGARDLFLQAGEVQTAEKLADEMGI